MDQQIPALPLLRRGQAVQENQQLRLVRQALLDQFLQLAQEDQRLREGLLDQFLQLAPEDQQLRLVREDLLDQFLQLAPAPLGLPACRGLLTVRQDPAARVHQSAQWVLATPARPSLRAAQQVHAHPMD